MFIDPRKSSRTSQSRHFILLLRDISTPRNNAIMVYTSPVPEVEIPKTDLLTYLFPPGQKVSEDPIWIDAACPENSLSPRQLLNWVKRLGIGLDRLGIKSQEAVMILSPNHIYVPAAYLGIVGSRRVFSAGNPIYTVSGAFAFRP